MSDPCVTDWLYEKIPGRGWAYDETDLVYDGVLFDTLPITYDTLGQATDWLYELPIDGCVADAFLFMDGTAYEFQDGTEYEFN